MKHETAAPSAHLKERAIEELKAYWIITLYLAVFFSALTNYRRLVLAEYGVTYVHFGFALIEALIIAKVILIGRAFGLGRRFEHKPLAWSVIHKSLVFGMLVLLFGILERVVEGLLHREGMAGILQRIAAIGADEITARAVMVVVAFVPFFAIWEIGRAVGLRKLSAMFFSPRAEGSNSGEHA